MTASKIHAGTYRSLSFHLWPQKKSENSTQERVFFLGKKEAGLSWSRNRTDGAFLSQC